jgi:hypothetical protein
MLVIVHRHKYHRRRQDRNFIGHCNGNWSTNKLSVCSHLITVVQGKTILISTSGQIHVKVNLSLYLSKHHATKTYWGSGGKAARILNLGTTWRWVVSFTLRPLYLRGTARIGGWVDPRTDLDAVMKRRLNKHVYLSCVIPKEGRVLSKPEMFVGIRNVNSLESISAPNWNTLFPLLFSCPMKLLRTCCLKVNAASTGFCLWMWLLRVNSSLV